MLPADFKDLAELLAQFGRDGDTELAHVNKDEIKMLKDAGGRGSRNPHTGLLEFADLGGSSGTSGDAGSGLGNASGDSGGGASGFAGPSTASGLGIAGSPAPDQGLQVGPLGQLNTAMKEIATNDLGIPSFGGKVADSVTGFLGNPGPALAGFGANALVGAIPGLGTYNTLAGLSNTLLGTSLPTAGGLVQAVLAQGTPNNSPAVIGGQGGGSEGASIDNSLGNLAPAQVTPTTQTATTPSPTPTPTTSASATPVANPYYGGQQDVSSYLQSINAFFNNPTGVLA